MKKIFILGGTGFLGYYTTQELLKRGYSVKTLSLPPMPTEDLLPKEVECQLGDINEFSDEKIVNMLSDCDGFVYAAGADERVVPEAPAMKFFYEANVLLTQRLARLAKKAGVKKFVVFGSYFAEFAERLPEFKLREQAYPNNRLLQEQIAFAEGEGSMDVTSLRLPYIFGTMPGREPLWKMFTDQLKDQDHVVTMKGGTAAVTVEQVAEAAVGALEKGVHRTTYAISGLNIKHADFYKLMLEALGQADKKEVEILPYESLKASYVEIDDVTKAEGKEHGIHQVVAGALQAEDLFIEPAETMSALGIKDHDVMASIKESLARAVAD